MNKKLDIYGVRPVLELLESKKEIDTIYLQKDINTEWSKKIKQESKNRNINIKLVPKHKLNRMTKKNHQGVIGLVSHIIFQNFENLLSSIFSQGHFPLFLLLDRITDVRNFGSICRSAEAMGVHGIIIPKKESAQINEIAIKASSGSISNINICRVDNLVHIAHNVKIGNNCMIAGQVGFAGSTVVGNNVVIGGQAGVSGHLRIGNNVKIGGGSGVINDIPDNCQVMGYPAVTLKEFIKNRKSK